MRAIKIWAVTSQSCWLLTGVWTPGPQHLQGIHRRGSFVHNPLFNMLFEWQCFILNLHLPSYAHRVKFDPREFTYEFTRFRSIARMFWLAFTQQTRCGMHASIFLHTQDISGLTDHFQQFWNGRWCKRVKHINTKLIFSHESISKIEYSLHYVGKIAL